MARLSRKAMNAILMDDTLFKAKRLSNWDFRLIATKREAKRDSSCAMDSFSNFSNAEVPGLRKLKRRMLACKPTKPCVSGACSRCARALGAWLERGCAELDKGFRGPVEDSVSFSFRCSFPTDRGPMRHTDDWGAWMNLRYHVLLNQAGLHRLFELHNVKVILGAQGPRLVRLDDPREAVARKAA